MSHKHRIPFNKLETFTKEIFMRVGLDKWGAEVLAHHLVAANLRGVDSHGVSRIPLYSERMLNGDIAIGTDVDIVKEAPSFAWIDGKNRHGILVAQRSIELAVEKAKKNGIAVVGVKNSNHFGMLAYYGQYAVKNDCIGFITSNASPSMPPWGGGERFFGTSPICYAIPTGVEEPVIGDMATSIVARGKIRLAATNSETIQTGWALNKEGLMTTDANEALEGMVLPMGGAKGYALVVLIETLSAILTGAAFGPHVGAIVEPGPQNLGHFFLIMRPDIFQDIHEFKTRMDTMIREIKDIKKMDGVDRIYLPGEIEHEIELERKKTGIPLSEKVYKQLLNVAEKLRVDSSFIHTIST